jgi:sugar lactone lactonase YvrE
VGPCTRLIVTVQTVGPRPGFSLSQPSWDDTDFQGLSGGLDGLEVDACGNVYVTEFVKGLVYRISSDGSNVEEAAELPSTWIPNLHWGRGLGGFEKEILYVSDRDDGRLFAISAGVASKPVAFP